MKKSIGISLIKLLSFTAVTAGVIIVGVNVVVNYKDKKNTINENEQVEKIVISEGQLAVKINSVLDFKDGSSYAKANIVNNDNNLYDMIIKIYDDNNKLLYTSMKIKPGENIEELKLDKSLDKGKHSATAYFEGYSGDKYVGKTGTKIMINVEN